MSDGSDLHYIVSLMLMLGSLLIFGRGKNNLLALGLTILVVLGLGIGKEVYDLTTNRWNLSQKALWDDSINDLAFDCAGTITGIVCWILIRNKKR